MTPMTPTNVLSRCFLPIVSVLFFACEFQTSAAESPSTAETVAWRKGADQGDADAQYHLGMHYLSGAGLIEDKWIEYLKKPKTESHNYGHYIAPADDFLANEKVCSAAESNEKAVEWFRKSADQGHAGAQLQMGSYYTKGCNVPSDLWGSKYNFEINDTEAVKWYRKAAEQGNAVGQFELGFHYYTGKGVPKSDDEQFKWFRKAADQGQVDAQEMLGICYASGVGVTKDVVLAYMWFSLATAGGKEGAMERREGMTQWMSQKDIAKAQKLSGEWKPTTGNNAP